MSCLFPCMLISLILLLLYKCFEENIVSDSLNAIGSNFQQQVNKYDLYAIRLVECSKFVPFLFLLPEDSKESHL